MPSAEENYLLLWCIIEQRQDDNGTLALDWDKVAKKMGSDNIGSTKSRWHRLRTDFQKMGFMNGPDAVDLSNFKVQAPKTKTPKAAATPKPKKTANPKARSAVEKKGGAKGKGKKSKATVEEEEEQEQDDEEMKEVESDAKDEEMKEEGADEEEA